MLLGMPQHGILCSACLGALREGKPSLTLREPSLREETDSTLREAHSEGGNTVPDLGVYPA